MQSIAPQELEKLRRNGQRIDLIDVRTPAEFREIHVEFARNVPLERLDPKSVQAGRAGQTDEPLYVICQSGRRGEQACEQLLRAGCATVINVEGGTIACAAAGLPVVRGKKTISLERQVRITAGTLILTGAVLGYFVHPYWIGLAAVMGVGLVVSGITDRCHLALLLARMPWNQVAQGHTTKPTGGACCGG